MVFLRMDAAKIINAEYIEELRQSDPETNTIARALWALDEAAPMSPELRSLHGFASQGFDLASCMFAVHYFFDSMQRLRAFAMNVANQLRAGGHFFGTCLDGDRVARALAGVATGMSVEGRKDGRLLWNITKLFDDVQTADPSKKKKKKGKDDVQSEGGGADPRIGRRIRVFVETIGHEIDEYLVDMPLLIEVMAEKGLHPMSAAEASKLKFPGSTGFFDDLFSAMASQPTQQQGQKGQNVQAVAMQMSDAEKTYSFMHRWFVFTKR
ncbi:mRNA cap guanine-N7 methyltransferase [Tetrabaena socialis]|uniref:mRNA (guanine-N(7))-methyltransferase n=1 Tax=Tetrabaena socialis TaxID=47790 RepID=A0A2J7ZK57_9CHLO|nr:mRNA cap guanine-N7 methyltransferase [Tetrabaena socialis]|eukprot:PNH00655.1 mRNA cap guanine-N7 methyltransferase [Tetrabaena socialis]